MVSLESIIYEIFAFSRPESTWLDELLFIRVFGVKAIKITNTSNVYGAPEISHVLLVSPEFPIFRGTMKYLCFLYRGYVTRYSCV